MASLDHPVVLSLLFKPRYLAVADAGQLELVSRRFRDFSRRYRQRLTYFNMKQVLETCTKPKVLLSTVADQFPNLGKALDVKQEWLAPMATLPRLEAMSISELTLNADSLALLKSMPRLRVLTVWKVRRDQGFEVDDAEPLNLYELAVLECRNLVLLCACRPQLLTTLTLHLPENLRELEIACRVLRRCVNLKMLTVENQLLDSVRHELLFWAVEALPGLQDLYLPGQVEVQSWQGFWRFYNDERICRSLTRLKMTGNHWELQLVGRTLPNLRHLELDDQVSDAEHIFEVQPTLELLKYRSKTIRGATEFGVAQCRGRLQTTRFAFES